MARERSRRPWRTPVDAGRPVVPAGRGVAEGPVAAPAPALPVEAVGGVP